MKRNKYTYSFIVLTLLAMFFNVPLKVVATEYSTNDQEITYDYYDTASESFKTATLSANSYTLVTSSSTTWTSGFYVLGSNIDIQERVKIDGNVTLILAGENTLNCLKGIEVSDGNTFNICNQTGSTGTLNATGEETNAGIGASTSYNQYGAWVGSNVGTIIINGGIVTAKSGDGQEGNEGYIGSGIGGIKRIVSSDRKEYMLGNEGLTAIYGGEVTTISSSSWDGMSHTIESISTTSFTTGKNGKAIIYANNILDRSKENEWSCITYLGNNITVYGNQTLADDLTIQNDYTLNISTDASFTMDDEYQLINNGTININGKLNVKSLINNKTLNTETSSNLVVRDRLNNCGELNTNGSVNCKNLLNSGNIENNNNFTCEDVTNNGTIFNNETLSATGTITGDGCVISTTSNVTWKNEQILTPDKLQYINENGEKVSISSEDAIYPVIPSAITWKKLVGKNTWYVVTNDQEIGPVKLEDDVNLLLLNGATLKVNGVNDNGGINASNHTLNIYAQSNNENTGKLIVTAGHENWMAIGGSNATINVYGGLIEAEYNANKDGCHSGIGPARYNSINKITITGGIIKTISIGRIRDNGSVGSDTAGLYAPVGSNAIIYTNQTNAGNIASTFNGILFLNKEGMVYGNQNLGNSLAIEQDETLTIPENTTLKVLKGQTLTIKGKLKVNGYIENSGTVVLEDGYSIEGNGKVRINFDSTLSGTISDDYIEYQTAWDTNGDGAVDDNTYTAKGAIPSHTGGSKDPTTDTVYTFDAWSPELVAMTEPNRYTASFTSSVRKYNVNLPTNPIGYTVNTNNELSLEYQSLFNFGVNVIDGYSKTNNFVVKVNDNAIEAKTDGTYEIEISSDVTISVEGVVRNVSIVSSDASIEYNGETIDVSNYFVIDNNADAVVYSIVDEGTTGEGTLLENILTVTKTGTFKIKALTEANETYAKGEGVATLIIDNGVIEYTATDYSGIYDGLSHSITINVTSPSDTNITYSIDGINYDENLPQYINVSNNIVYYKIEKDNYSIINGFKNVIINKRPITISASNQTITYGNDIDNKKYVVGGLLENDAITNIKLNANTDKGVITISDVSIRSGTSDVTKNYDITLKNGKLNVEYNNTSEVTSSPSLLRIEAKKGKTKYNADEVLNVNDIVVVAYYDDGYSEKVYDYLTNTSNISMSTGGYKNLRISYKTKITDILIYVSFKIIDGENSSWTQESNEDLTIVGNGNYKDFKNIKVDGEIVDDANYEATEGPTTITLKASYLDTLDLGNHEIEINWKDGSASTSFKILENKSENTTDNKIEQNDKDSNNNVSDSNVQTKDTSKLEMWMIIIAILIVVLCGILVIRNKSTSRKDS